MPALAYRLRKSKTDDSVKDRFDQGLGLLVWSSPSKVYKEQSLLLQFHTLQKRLSIVVQLAACFQAFQLCSIACAGWMFLVIRSSEGGGLLCVHCYVDQMQINFISTANKAESFVYCSVI